MKWFKDPGNIQVAVTAALITTALGCSLFGVVSGRLSAGAPQFPPGEKLQSFLQSHPAAGMGRLPIVYGDLRVSLSLYDFSRYPGWHPLYGEKSLTLLVRPKKAQVSGQPIIQLVMIDLEHDGQVDFVIEGERAASEATLTSIDSDLIRPVSAAEQALFEEITENPQLVSTLDRASFQYALDWIRNRT